MPPRKRPPNSDIPGCLVWEMDQVRIAGWHDFKADKLTLLKAICGAARPGETIEDSVRELLIDALDPKPSSGARQPLAQRPRQELGLTMRILFGEPEEIKLPARGEHPAVEHKLRNTTSDYRVQRAEEICGASIGALNRNGNERRAASRDRARLREIAGDLARAHPELTETVHVDAATTTEVPPTPLETVPEEPNQTSAAASRVVPRPSALSEQWAIIAMAVVVICLAAVAIWTLPSDPAGTTPSGPYSAELMAENTSFGSSKGATSVRADPRDRLQLSLSLRNASSTPTGPLYLYADPLSSSDPLSARVRFVIAFADGRIFAALPPLTTRGWNRFGSFSFNEPSESTNNSGDPFVTTAPKSPAEFAGRPLSTEDVEGPIAIDGLDAGQSRAVRVMGEWSAARFTYLASGQVDFDVNRSKRFSPTHQVKPGDHLRFYASIGSPGAEVMADLPVDARFKNGPSGSTQVSVRISTDEKSGWWTPAIVTNNLGRRLKLEVVPGSTELIPSRPDKRCRSGAKRETLSDGIATGGTSIPKLGGFARHSPCGGAEFDVFLKFEAIVKPIDT